MWFACWTSAPNRRSSERVGISLVSAPILGFDLVRHPLGSEIADILLTALTLGPHDLLLFTPDTARVFRRMGAWHTVNGIVDARGAGVLTGSVLAANPAVADRAVDDITQLADSLMRSMIVDLDDLERLIRSDVLLWTTSPTGPRSTLRAIPRGDDMPDTELVKCAGDALIDAIAARWIDGLHDEVAAVLSEPYQLVLTQLPERAPDIGPCAPGLAQFLTTLRALSAGDRDRLRTVAELMRGTGPEWAAAVHEASWAALTTGRIRSAATAQLLGAQAFRAAGFTAADGAEGLWNTISGHIQAEVVSDVLSATTYEHLTRSVNTALAIVQ
jgi:hypothetical protein